MTDLASFFDDDDAPAPPPPDASLAASFFDDDDGLEAERIDVLEKKIDDAVTAVVMAESAMVVAGAGLPTDLDQRTFVNEYLSVSRLKRWESCPASFEAHYIKKLPSDFSEAGAFGSMLHEALESLYKWIVETKHKGKIPEDKLVEFYREAWAASQLSGGDLYSEGLGLLRSYLAQNAEADYETILGVELEFWVKLEEFTIYGKIDRVDKVNDETVKIIDYKSNRLLFSRDELDTDLQMSAYSLAVRQAFPWAKHIQYEFHMLRHGVELHTERTEAQIEDAAGYVLAEGRQSERAKEYPARIGPFCGYCDHRRTCAAYQLAVTRGDELVAEEPEELEAIGQMYERAHAIEKIAVKKKRDLAVAIRAQLENKASVTLAGTTYRLVPWNASTAYPMDKAFPLLAKLGLTHEQIIAGVCEIAPKKLDAFLGAEGGARELGAKGSQVQLVKAMLDVVAVKTPGSPRLTHTPVKGTKRKHLEIAPSVIEGVLEEPASAPPAKLTEGESKPAKKKAAAKPKARGPNTHPKRVATKGPKLYCTECGQPQFNTTSGETCKNGHGGAPGVPKKDLPKIESSMGEPWTCSCGWTGFGATVNKHRAECAKPATSNEPIE